ncbi:bombyxin B-1 homolog [Argiope bruennichi]|uniref:Bombyxin B-1 like protein n=1 Tax=Argiope bruennichi TaxID=94029 RepID=A0A8T0EGI4_ARGBR|nr:bombyxin B-1 homolog [Argiope bruennichi]KAF8771055.1 Bombyxin B-1 like protein [Argiope bruennichi]
MAFKYLCLLVACLILASVDGMPRHHSIQKRSMRLCGRMLVDALATVCQNEYYDPNHIQMRKRNYAYTADTYPSWDNSMTDFKGFVDPQTALDFFGLQMPRNPRGVADECCSKSCTFHQLLSYCGPSSRSLEK